VLADGYKNAAWAEEVLADNSRTQGAVVPVCLLDKPALCEPLFLISAITV
jgi:hypothetical protein